MIIDFLGFDNDEKIKRAICMALINIGELVKNLTDEFRSLNPNIPWWDIAGLIDVTAYRYQALRMEDIWETIKTDLPIIKVEIKKMISIKK